MKIALIGCGNIGRAIAGAVASGAIPGSRIVAVADIVASDSFKDICRQHNCPGTLEPEELTRFQPDLVVEAASPVAVRQYAAYFLGHGLSFMAMSTGVFADEDLFASLSNLAATHNCYLYIPSGAVGGVDILSAHQFGGLESVTITVRKPPANLVRYNKDGSKENFSHIVKPTVVYEGPASEAVSLFPENVNVSATISLAGVGATNTTVKVVADPTITRNIHEIVAHGRYGRFTLVQENLPSPENPKTSYMACLSAITMLKKIGSHVRLGT